MAGKSGNIPACHRAIMQHRFPEPGLRLHARANIQHELTA